MCDTIYRQDAIDAVKDLPNCHNGFSDTYDKACIIGVLEDLPSAQPRKTGKWILDTFQIRCNRCNKLFSDSLFPSKYCPNCGARMDGESDE